MKNVYIYCEGQTEEAFINEVLCPYLLNFNIYAQPIICSTKRTPTQKYKGGAVNYEKIKRELPMLCKMHRNEIVTTMFDYYGMPQNTPAIDSSELDIYKRIEIIEQAINSDLNQTNLFFNLMLHEFEGILFSKPQSFGIIADDNIVAALQVMKDEAISPEHINNSRETAPSKRILKLIPDYAKVKNGVLVSKDIGINTIITECKHFANWIEKIKTY